MLNRHKRQKRSDRLFAKWVKPVLIQHYPGFWQGTSGTHLDYKYCVDWMYNSPEGPQHWATRSWMARPYQNHCVRYRKSTAPHQKVETQIMLSNLAKGVLFPDYTLEAWIWDGWIYIAISDSRVLWTYIRDNETDLPTIRLKNPSGYTEFLKVNFALLPVQPRKIVQRLENWEL
jgi:hypothetical protein